MYPVLPPGTLVKPQVRGLTFHWLRVVDDPGPEHLPKRVIVLARTEPERSDQWVRVCRDRVHADASRMSVSDVKPTAPPIAAAPARKPWARGKDGRYTALGEVWDCAQPLPATQASKKHMRPVVRQLKSTSASSHA
jgi:hypothetical protein